MSLSNEDRTRLTDQLVYLDKGNIINKLINLKNQHVDLSIRLVYLSVLSILSTTLGTPIYGTTDDNILAGFVDGSYTGEREKRLIFIRPLIGQILNKLQTALPHLGIYSLFLLFMLVVSFAIFGTMLTRRDESPEIRKISQISWVALSSPAIIWFSLAPTYTAISILCTCLSLMSVFINIILNKRSYLLFIFATILFILSFLVRPEGATGAILLSILPLAYLAYKVKKIDFKKVILVTLILIPISIYDNYLQHSTSNSAWNKYDNWNNLRHQVQHRVAEDQLLDLRVLNNWSIPEYHLFMDLSFGDERVFDKQWLEPAYENTYFTRGVNGLVHSNPFTVIQKIFDQLSKYYGVIVFQIILSIWIVVRRKSTKIEKVICMMTTWIPVCLAIYLMASNLHTPERTLYPLLLLPNIFLLTQNKIFQDKLESNLSLKVWAPLLLCSIFLWFFAPKGLAEQISLNHEQQKSATILQKELGTFDDQAIFIGPGNAELYDRKNPYLVSAQWNIPRMITSGNWETFSPYWYKRIEYLGLSGGSIYESLFSEKAYWLSFSVPDTSYMVELFLKENGYPKTNRENVANFTHGETLFKFLPN